MLIGVISLALMVVLSIVSALVFLPELKNAPEDMPLGDFQTPNININFALIDSDHVQNLEEFTLIEANFTYVAQNASLRQVAGSIFATTRQEAEQKLEAQNLKVIAIQQAPVGRSEPFKPLPANKK